MKVHFFRISAIVSLLSCEKEGEYNPKQKITKIYTKPASTYNTDSNIALRQTFEWDGDLLKKMTSYSGMPITQSYTFEYEKKQLIKIFDGGGSVLASVMYEDGKVSKLEFYSMEGLLIASESYEYTDSKLTRLTQHNHILTDSKELKNSFSMLDLLLPNHSFKSDDEIVKTLEFEWAGDNISKSTATYPSYTRVEEYEYDDMYNPFYKSMQYSLGMNAPILSKNNVVKIIYENPLFNIECDYEYENKFPVKRTMSTEADADNTYSLHYEYE